MSFLRRWQVYLFLCLWGSGLGAGCATSPVGLGKLTTDQEDNWFIFTEPALDRTSRRTVLLYNAGEVAIQIHSIKLIENEHGFFQLERLPKLPFALAPGQKHGVEIVVAALPGRSGRFSSTIAVYAPDAENVDDQGNFFIGLHHKPLTPIAKLSCAGKLDFGTVARGLSHTMTCTLANVGPAPLHVRGVSYQLSEGAKDDFRWEGPNTAEVAPAGKNNVTFKITYAPSEHDSGKDQGVFLLDSNSPVPIKIHVSGVTAFSLITLVPNYGTCQTSASCKAIDQRLWCAQDAWSGSSLCLPGKEQTPFLAFPFSSKAQIVRKSFWIRASGTQPLRVQAIELDSTTSGDFKLSTQGLSFPLVLAPRAEKEITVEYLRSDDRQDTGRVLVISNAGNHSQAALLLEAATKGCNLEVSPREHKFRAPKPPLTVNITNTGNEPCILKKVSLQSSGKGSSFSLLPTPAANQTIVPNGRIDFLVNFSPTDRGPWNDVVVIESSDPDEPVIKVPMKGTIEIDEFCRLKASPRRLAFGLVGVGRSRKLSLNLSNEAWDDCKITSLNIAGTKPAGNNAFQLDSQIQLPIRISSGSSVRLEVSYTPPQELPGYEGTLTIASDDRTNPSYVVDLTGSSGTLCLEVVPVNMDFGSSKFGCATPTRKIQVFNLGAPNCQKSITISRVALAQGTTSEFRIMSPPQLPRTINIGENIEIGMSYKPKTVGLDTGTLELENNVQGQSPVVIPLVGEGVSTDEQKDVFKQPKRPRNDILFVVDDSSSMGDDQDNLAKNFQSFIRWAVRLNVDYQIMITTTDVTGSRYPAGCGRGNPKIITPLTPDPAKAFAANVRVGTAGSAMEKGLEAAYRALIPPALNGCNKGFYRQDASLLMIFVSDEADQSPQTTQFYISFFRSLKGIRNLDQIGASVIVGPPPNGCRDPKSTTAQSAPRYWQVSRELHGVQESICSRNWAATLSNIGSISIGHRVQFFLSRRADPNTIQVKVNGVIAKESPQDGWQYDPSSNVVAFAKAAIPPPGATIQIEYKAVCLQ